MSANGRPVVTDEQVEAWAEALLSDDVLLDVSWQLRRWTRDALAQLSVGWDGERYTLPVRDDGFALIGLLRYAPAALRDDSQPKTIASPGSTRELFPAPESIDSSEIWLQEGEPDTIVATALGLPAVGVPGTGGWKREWAPRFAHRDTVLVPDCDTTGRLSVEKIADDLLPHAASVRIIDLDPARDDGYDLSDFVADADSIDELRQAAELLREMAKRAPVIEPELWPRLRRVEPLPLFPVDALPPTVADMVRATAVSIQVPVDLVACDALGVLAACSAGHAQVEIGPDWIEELVLWLLCVLPSGERKSAAQRMIVAPLRELERQWREESLGPVARARSDREVKRQRQLYQQRQSGHAKDPQEREAARIEAKQLADELASTPEPVEARLIADDVTAEALVGLLARHGQIAVFAAESALLDNLAGRYSDGKPNYSAVNQAYSGESTSSDRRSRDTEQLERPLVTITLSPQPIVMRDLLASQVARGRGFIARFALCAPESLLGRREIDPPPVLPEVKQAWADLVSRLAEAPKTPDTTDTTGSVSSVTRFQLSRDARRLLYGVLSDSEPDLGEGGDLEEFADWCSRHPGRIARFAAHLHRAAEQPGDEISETTMRAALRIGDWSLAHAQALLTGHDSDYRRALAWLIRHGEAEISLRDLQRGMSNATSDDARELADRLEARGVLRALEQPMPSKRGGRPPSPRFAVHPDLRRGASE
jgi:replicative DNA helicase